MYFRKQQISQKIGQISQQRHLHDKSLAELQGLIANNKKHDVVELRKKFTDSMDDLQKIVKQNMTVLDLLSYRCQKLQKQGIELSNQVLRIQSLKQYFSQLKSKVQREQKNGEQVISGRQRWQLTKYSSGTAQVDEQQSLLYSNKAAKQATQMARSVYENLSNQGGRLQAARMKMGEVLQNINLSGNIAQLLKTRTRQDNKLIMRLSVGLIFWIIICLFVLKPIFRGQ